MLIKHNGMNVCFSCIVLQLYAVGGANRNKSCGKSKNQTQRFPDLDLLPGLLFLNQNPILHDAGWDLTLDDLFTS